MRRQRHTSWIAGAVIALLAFPVAGLARGGGGGNGGGGGSFGGMRGGGQRGGGLPLPGGGRHGGGGGNPGRGGHGGGGNHGGSHHGGGHVHWYPYFGGFYGGFYGSGFYGSPFYGSPFYDPFYDPFYRSYSYEGDQQSSGTKGDNVTIKVSPESTSVYVNGLLYSSHGRAHFNLPIGQWKVELRAPGYIPQVVELNVQQGVRYSIERKLEKDRAAPTGKPLKTEEI